MPALADIREGQVADRELTFPVQTKAAVLLAADARVTQRSRQGAPGPARLIRTASSASCYPLGGMRLAVCHER